MNKSKTTGDVIVVWLISPQVECVTHERQHSIQVFETIGIDYFVLLHVCGGFISYILFNTANQHCFLRFNNKTFRDDISNQRTRHHG